MLALVRIRAVSVFEGIVYQSFVVDPTNPLRPTLEVEAVLRQGDADEGPLLLSVAEFLVMSGDQAVAAACVDDLAAQGRLVEHLGVPYLAFPFWTPVDISGPPGSP
jgi:hypothetical protein